MSNLEHDPLSQAPASPLSANLPHRPADDREEVYYEGSPLVRGAIGKNIGWELLGVGLIIVPASI